MIDELLKFLMFVHRDVGKDKQMKRLLVTAWNRSRTSRWFFFIYFLFTESFVTFLQNFHAKFLRHP